MQASIKQSVESFKLGEKRVWTGWRSSHPLLLSGNRREIIHLEEKSRILPAIFHSPLLWPRTTDLTDYEGRMFCQALATIHTVADKEQGHLRKNMVGLVPDFPPCVFFIEGWGRRKARVPAKLQNVVCTRSRVRFSARHRVLDSGKVKT